MNSTRTKSVSVILVEDHEITRVGLRKILELMPEISVVGEAGDGKTAVAKAIEVQPSLVLMDIGLPDMDGIQATKLIKQACAAKIILITSHEEERDVFAGLTAGADAYCLKGISSQQLANVVSSVMNGVLWLDPGVAHLVVNAIKSGNSPFRLLKGVPSCRFGLSEREFGVLSLLVEGLSNQEMANHLHLSHETVKTHMRHIMEKLDVTDRTQAAVKALTSGLIWPKMKEVNA